MAEQSFDETDYGRDEDQARSEEGARAQDTHDLENVLDGLNEAAEDCDGELSVGAILDAFAARSFGALLTMVALVAALPVIGAIPGVSIVTGTLVILVAVQQLIGRDSPWTPQSLRKLTVDAETMQTAIEKTRPYAARIDSVIRPRLTFLTKGLGPRIAISLASIALALLFYPLALVPGGVWPPALSVMVLGLALIGNDGVLALIGGAGAIASLALVLTIL